MTTLLELDKRHVWHPFTQHATERDPVEITHAKGSVIYDKDGREILDMICSWWTCTHGHSHPELNKALAEQAEKAAHVMFAGFTHEPGVKLASNLANLLPGTLNRVFYSDNGSTSVEVALKLAYQYWRNIGESERTAFIGFEGGYHGDTFGAMSVGQGSGYFKLFEDLMCAVHTVPFAMTWHNDDSVEYRETAALEAMKRTLSEQRGKVAAIILEPLMQGASGMRFCRPEFVHRVLQLAREENVLVIFDEVATGFGRTGSMFACNQINDTPDIICLSKGLTAGYMPLSVTVAKDEIFDVFLGEDFGKALAHGHSFTANPLACAVALRSIELFKEENTLEKIAQINKHHTKFLEQLSKNEHLEHARILGSVIACQFKGGSGYKSEKSVELKDWYLSAGANIRPIGNVLYLMPPYCTTETELHNAYDIMINGIETVFGR